MPAIWLGGTFDLLHPGHVHLMRTAAQFGLHGSSQYHNYVTVAVNTDEFVSKYRGRAPVQPLSQRLEMVREMRSVSSVQTNPGGDAQPDLILRAGAEVILVGDDWAPPRDYLAQIGVDQAWLDEHWIRVEFLPRVGGLSSTLLKRQVRAAPVG